MYQTNLPMILQYKPIFLKFLKLLELKKCRMIALTITQNKNIKLK